MNFSRVDIDREMKELYGDDILLFQNAEHWKINIFFYYADEKKMDKKWSGVSSSISAIYQADFDSNKEFEKWNIYLIFVSNSPVSKELKNKIENDRFSNRKIIEDNFKNDLNDETANELIVKHITNTDLIGVIELTNDSIQEIYEPVNKSLWDLIPQQEIIKGDTKKQKDLIELLKQLKNEN